VATISACATTSPKDAGDDRYLFRKDDSYVRLDPIESDAPANAHPFVVSSSQLRRMFVGLQVSGAFSASKDSIFSENDLKAIIPYLSSALSRASPRQDVTFAVADARGIFGSYSTRFITTGRLFVRGDKLNLIFGLIHERLEAENLDYTAVTPPIIPGSRARRVDTVIWKIESPNVKFADGRGDWLVFDQSAMTPPKVLGEEPAPRVEGGEREFERRLQVLKGLREKGVITEEEYAERRRAILQEL